LVKRQNTKHAISPPPKGSGLNAPIAEGEGEAKAIRR
jgi:hypothetical protein